MRTKHYGWQSRDHVLQGPERTSTEKPNYFEEGRLLFLRQWKVYVLPRFKHKTSTVREGEMNKRKLGSFALCAMLFALCQSAEAQQPAKVPRIGWLSNADAATDSARAGGLRLALRERGYIEG